MKKIELGRTGIRLSQYALGTMLMGTSISQQDSFGILDDYMERGGNFLDTANCYSWWVGNGQFCGDESETVIGNWLKARENRSEVFIATKIGARLKDHRAIRDHKGNPTWEGFEPERHFEGASRDVIINSFKDCLDRLQTDYIDLLYVHVDDRNTPIEETLECLNDLVLQGKVHHLGFSNIQTWRLEEIFNVCTRRGWKLPVAVQQEFSYIHPANYLSSGFAVHAKGELFDWLNYRDGISLVAYSPLLKGIYRNKEKAESLIRSSEYNSKYTREKIELINRISEENKIDPNILVLKWMSSLEDEVFILLGFSRREQYIQNIRVTEIDVPDDVLQRLQE